MYFVRFCSFSTHTVWGLGLGDSQRALPTETNVESGTHQSKSGTSVKVSNSGDLPHSLAAMEDGEAPRRSLSLKLSDT